MKLILCSLFLNTAMLMNTATIAHAQTPTTPAFRTLLTVAAISAMTEMQLTESCVARGTCREVNYFMPKGQSAGATIGRAAVKGAGAAIVIRSSLLLWRRGHKWESVAVAGGFLGFNAYLAQRAARQ